MDVEPKHSATGFERFGTDGTSDPLEDRREFTRRKRLLFATFES